MKINPFDYLFYKLVRFMTPLGYYSPEAHVPLPMSLIFTFNIWTVLNIFAGDYNSNWLILVFFIPFIIVMTVYFPVTRWEKIEERYETESHEQRMIGNWLVFLYVAATIGLLVWSFRFIPVNN